MGDDRFTFLHQNEATVQLLGTGEDVFDFPLPSEDIDVPRRLVPRYQAEEDEGLPSNTHPSYPFGNPYASSSSRNNPSHTFVSQHSLASTLSALELPKGRPQAERQWTDLGLDQLLPLADILEGRRDSLDVNKAADQVAREGEEAQHRAANDIQEPSGSGSASQGQAGATAAAAANA